MISRFVVFLIILIVFSVGCTRQPEQITTINNTIEEATPTKVLDLKEVVMKEYISEFLTKGYSYYYGINSIESNVIMQHYENNKIEAMVYTNMNNCNPVKDPDTVPYIMAAKEKAFKERDSDKKHKLQKEYLRLYSEYLKPFESNFTFKLTAELENNEINEASIQLFIETAAAQGVKYEPAESILPKK
jgi:hypothetical protein